MHTEVSNLLLQERPSLYQTNSTRAKLQLQLAIPNRERSLRGGAGRKDDSIRRAAAAIHTRLPQRKRQRGPRDVGSAVALVEANFVRRRRMYTGGAGSCARERERDVRGYIIFRAG